MNKKKEPYKKYVEWRFEAGREEWAIIYTSEDRKAIWIEETRKNGQEDCHISDCFFLKDNSWVVDPESSIKDMCGSETVRAIEKYLNTHGIPEGIEVKDGWFDQY